MAMRSALYYPHTDVRSEALMKSALLTWDKLHSIIPHSDKLKMKWTVRRAAPDRLHIALTLEDEEAFTEPVVTTNIYRRKSDPNWQVLDDGSCFENNRTAVDEDGDTDGFTKF